MGIENKNILSDHNISNDINNNIANDISNDINTNLKDSNNISNNNNDISEENFLEEKNTDISLTAIKMNKKTNQEMDKNKEGNVLEKTEITLKDEAKINKNMGTLSACLALVHCTLFGMILQIMSNLPKVEFIQKAGLCLFILACFSNVFVTLAKLECTLCFMFVDVLFAFTTILLMSVFKKINMALSCVIFSMFGVGIGIVMNVVPVYISLVCSEKYKVFLLNSIGGLGIVFGLIVGNNLIYFINVLAAKIVFLIISLGFIFYFFTYAHKAKVSGKLKVENFTKIFKKGINSLILLSLGMIASNLAGINYIVLNSSNIFKGKGKHTEIIYFNITNFLSIGMTYLSYALNNYVFGRKLVFIFSSCFVLLGNYLFFITDLEHHKWVSILFIIGFNLGVASVPFIIMCEIFPMEVIQEGAMMGNIAYWMGGVMSMVVFDPLSAVGFKVAMIYLAVMVVYFILFFKETKEQQTPQYQPNRLSLSLF